MIGEAPGSPRAATVLHPWLDDVLAGDVKALAVKCWTQPPAEMESRYGDADAIRDAVTRPGVLIQFGAQWRGDEVTVHLRPAELDSECGCPDVYRDEDGVSDEKARYTVVRYLSRHLDRPVNPADTESAYPLLCFNAEPPDLAEVAEFEVGSLQVARHTPAAATVSGPVETPSADEGRDLHPRSRTERVLHRGCTRLVTAHLAHLPQTPHP
ncbi:hypothetical protein IU433_13040 [Nocardia puris]|uniref:hypothetical protein n=1 Tax=Nocardia puris TaxID=208602 RepID=UPI0018941C43|nr:hypothetical protein [Nocardia puris]MBF6213572.1 hypothetical protein [Nocardia puris]MBF6365498.1 hypothetical protein [Nocardia puris]MBF6459964.1 hypothetical protein [Nocardia puris]